ncbi:MAG: hypothetical protein GY835_19350 [bacterium]|nr:hypothetical protein [bacterium]
MPKPNKKGDGATNADARVDIPDPIKDELLRRCKRVCCMCFGLRGDTEIKDGQLAHLDRNRTNAHIDNLAYLCLECHKIYDLKSNRVLAYTPGEVRFYRDQLYRHHGHDQVEWTLVVRANRSRYEIVKKAVDEAHSMLRKASMDVTFAEEPLG